MLNPEWLTKAIGAVLEDRPTRAASGVLSHSRLAEIWQSGSEANYETRYHPYFLRLMEKFDVSYRLDDENGKSLVAQMVPYERPELPWDKEHPLGPGMRILRLTCALSEPAPGLIAWLTVRLNRFSTHRHWRRGVFFRYPIDLYNSEALLEMTDDRHLAVEVRAPSPDFLFNVIRDSVEDLMIRRWPGISYVLYVPCPDVSEGDPCNGRFKLEALMRLRARNRQEIVCQECTNYHDINMLLTGFETYTPSFQERFGEITDRLGDIAHGVQRLELYASESSDSLRKLLRAVTSEAADCPRLFTLQMQEDPNRRRGRLWEYHYILTLWCEHPDSWHACESGTYVIDEPREWLRHVAPYVRLIVKTLHTVLPIAGVVAGMVFDSQVYRDIEHSIDSTRLIVDNLPIGKDWRGLDQIELPLADNGLTLSEASGLRAFRKTLFELDPYQRFGGLRRVQGASGDFLWVCNRHYREYDPGLPILPAKRKDQARRGKLFGKRQDRAT